MLGSSPDSLPNGNGRVAHETLQRVIWLMHVAQFAYLGSWLLMVVYWTSGFSGIYLGEFFLPGALLLALVAWITTLMLTTACQSGMFLIALTMCVPYIGAVPFLGCINYARRFLIWNGYRPGIVGAQPDLVELAAMEANPNYRPSARFNKDGSKRRLPVSLTVLLAGVVILIVASTATVIVTLS